MQVLTFGDFREATKDVPDEAIFAQSDDACGDVMWEITIRLPMKRREVNP